MRVLAFFMVATLVQLCNVEAFASCEWEELKGTHFIVNFCKDDLSFAREILREAEKNYSRIAHYLGYARYSNFWTWEHRVKIYIYPDRRSFSQARKRPQWSEGMADYTKKEIASYAQSKNFLETILPHEMAHLMFRDFVGFQGEVPLWLDEGVAQWAEAKRRQEVKALMRVFVKRKTLIPLKRMMTSNVRNVTNRNIFRVYSSLRPEAAPFVMRGNNFVKLYYLQAASLVGFLIERFGTERFTNFCRGLRDGKALREALKSSYPQSVSTMEGLEAEWLQYIQQE
ncbi:MAG: hypothetical protein JSW40_06375 [Candidatus Omnitrophota bacterium]|nr:MAG: hypothetical protein JSW40_06375 [Candidatus Omnitrophota bacterium]